MALFELDGCALLRSLLWLPSGAVFAFREVCRAGRQLLGDGPAALRLWRRELDSGVLGLVRGDELWLHALVEASAIAQFASLARRFSFFGDLQFREAGELASLVESMHGMATEVAKLSSGCCFAGSFAFDAGEIAALVGGPSGEGVPAVTAVRSRALRLIWPFASHDQLRFDMHLVATSAAGRGIHLWWQCNLIGDLLMEERDCLELCAFGSAVASAPGARSTNIRPYTLPELPVTLPPEVLRPEDPVYEELLQRGSLTCLLCFIVRSMGMDQEVMLAQAKASAKSEQKSPASGSPGGIALDFSDAAARGWRLRPALGAAEVAEEELEIGLNDARGGSGAQQGVAE